METQTDKSSWLPLLITGLAIILFSTAAIARMLGWGPNSTAEASVSATSETPARPRCPECGVILSIREIERHDEVSGPGAAGGVAAGNGDKTLVKSDRSYEIVVRMADGSNRVVNVANPARWRTGERLIVIGDVKPSNQ